MLRVDPEKLALIFERVFDQRRHFHVADLLVCVDRLHQVRFVDLFEDLCRQSRCFPHRIHFVIFFRRANDPDVVLIEC